MGVFTMNDKHTQSENKHNTVKRNGTEFCDFQVGVSRLCVPVLHQKYSLAC